MSRDMSVFLIHDPECPCVPRDVPAVLVNDSVVHNREIEGRYCILFEGHLYKSKGGSV